MQKSRLNPIDSCPFPLIAATDLKGDCYIPVDESQGLCNPLSNSPFLVN